MKMFRQVIKFSEKQLPKYMFALKSGEGKYTEIYCDTDNLPESYIKLFNDEKDANTFKLSMEKTETWFKAREYKIVRINTTLKKYKSRFVPLQYAFNQLYS